MLTTGLLAARRTRRLALLRLPGGRSRRLALRVRRLAGRLLTRLLTRRLLAATPRIAGRRATARGSALAWTPRRRRLGAISARPTAWLIVTVVIHNYKASGSPHSGVRR
ncbi:MAG TPA: hypothetical protein VG247_13630 [Pseudonocardiaceae bacterium]|nr:hypothetical protein [Pseudonocardiaceae bacterium]